MLANSRIYLVLEEIQVAETVDFCRNKERYHQVNGFRKILTGFQQSVG